MPQGKNSVLGLFSSDHTLEEVAGAHACAVTHRYSLSSHPSPTPLTWTKCPLISPLKWVTGLGWEPSAQRIVPLPERHNGKTGHKKPEVINLLSRRGRENTGNSRMAVLLTSSIISFNPHDRHMNEILVSSILQLENRSSRLNFPRPQSQKLENNDNQISITNIFRALIWSQ